VRHPEQVWWPAEGIRKRDVLAYYDAVAGVLLPHLRNRPYSLKRYPNGPRGPCFWIKDAPPEAPAWLRTSPRPAKSRGGALVRYPLVNDERSLLWLVDFGCVDHHVWLSRADKPDRPDVVLFDLDPRGGDVVEAALLLRAALDALGLESYVRTSGHEGVHVLVPLARVHAFEETRAFARLVAGAIHRTRRKLGVSVDAKMNGHGQQFVAAYSVRPKTARVCTPITWDELAPGLAFTMDEVLARVERLGDVHEPLLHGRQRLAQALERFA
jgi:bifunctional non-homologous end joining protein LigD